MKYGLRRNALFSIVEVIVSGLGLFFIYRNVVQELGLSMLGVWSLVLATTAFGRVADVGIAAGLARFVARAIADNDPARAVLYMRTAAIAVAILMGAIALVVWYPLWRALALALDGEDLAIARSILPWAILSFWLLNLKAVLDACLLGAHRADLRAISNIAGMVLQVAASLWLVRDFALFGLAWAQAGQYVLSLLLATIFLKTYAAVGAGQTVTGWFSRPQFRELLGFGIKLQIGTIANLMFEPACKIVLGTVGGTVILGIFEMAYRMVYQVRNVAIMALQTTIPAFATFDGRQPDDLRRLFDKVCRTAAMAGGGLMSVIALTSPLVSWLWLGEINYAFVCLSALLTIGWSINIFAAPAYFLGMADGRVMPNVLGQIVSGIIAPVSVYLIGMSFGPLAAVAGIALGKIPGDLMPAIFTRPGGSWRHSAFLNRYNIVAFALVMAIGSAMMWFAGMRM